MSIDPDTLARAGRLLLGAEWQRPLARLLGPLHPLGPRGAMDDRLVRRWLSGERSIPDWVPDALVDLLKDRANALLVETDECGRLAREIQVEQKKAETE